MVVSVNLKLIPRYLRLTEPLFTNDAYPQSCKLAMVWITTMHMLLLDLTFEAYDNDVCVMAEKFRV